MRYPLRKQIKDAWSRTIERDYQRQRVNSERSLQAAFWSHLNELFSDSARTIFLEPNISVPRGHRRVTYVPDLVICNARQIIGVIEIKFCPRQLPVYEKDLGTLQAIAAQKAEVQLQNLRYRGEFDLPRAYDISRQTLFVWAGVHRGGDEANVSFAAGIAALKGCYLELHAVTNPDGPTKIFTRSE